MRIAFTTSYPPEWRDFAAPIAAQKRQYCSDHGYTYVEHTRNIFPTSGKRIRYAAVKMLLPHFDWVCWSDADCALFNSAVKLESFLADDFSLVIANRYWCVDAGMLLLRNDRWGKTFLDWFELHAVETVHNDWLPEVSIPINRHMDVKFRTHFAGDALATDLLNPYPNFMVHVPQAPLETKRKTLLRFLASRSSIPGSLVL